MMKYADDVGLISGMIPNTIGAVCHIYYYDDDGKIWSKTVPVVGFRVGCEAMDDDGGEFCPILLGFYCNADNEIARFYTSSLTPGLFHANDDGYHLSGAEEVLERVHELMAIKKKYSKKHKSPKTP
jgi:hypothetical protein